MIHTIDPNPVRPSDTQTNYNIAKGLLSNREWEVLERTGCGLSAKDISKELFISTHTVQVHNRSIKKKLNMNTMILIRYIIVIQLILSACSQKNDTIKRFDLPLEDVLITVSTHKIEGDRENPILGVSDVKWLENNFYIVSGWQNLLMRYDASGKLISNIGAAGRGPCDFNLPIKLMLSEGNISVLEAGNSRIQVFTTNLECGEIMNLPFLPADAVYNDTNRNYIVVGSLYGGDHPKFIHVINKGEILNSFVNTPDELIFDYYSINHGDNVIWGNNNSRMFNSVNIKTGENREYQLLDTTFVSILEELADFELREQEDLRRLMQLTRQIPHSTITGVIFQYPYLLVSYQNKNTDQQNRLLIQEIEKGKILYATTIGDYHILENRVNDSEFILYKFNEKDLGSVDLHIVKLNRDKLEISIK
jgi:DNA-binding CsgD family transcriptional regulator